MSPPPGSATRLQACSSSPEQTRRLGAVLALALRPGDVVVLTGELGAGKTTLVQGMAGGLGVDDQVTSPTFTLVRPYRCGPPRRAKNPTEVRVLVHADLYRLERTAELADLALGQLVEEEAAAVVEWGEVADAALRKGAIVVELTAPDDDTRLLTVTLPEDRAHDAEMLRRRLAVDKDG